MYDVAIVGCGPVGAFAANVFGKAGLKTLVVDRDAAPYSLPRAVHLDHEMMRLFQSVGLIDVIEPDMRETDGHLHIGAASQVIKYMGTVGQTRPFGWANDYFFYQPELEAHLRGGLRDYSNVEVRLATSFESLSQNSDGVTLSLRSGAGLEECHAKWVIACDGASSSVRKSLNITLDDLDFEEPWLVVDADVKGPVRFPKLEGVPAGADLQRLSVMMCDPRRPATIVPGGGDHRRWEFMLLPGEDDREMMKPENVAKLVGSYVEGVPHELVRAATYRFHGLVAEKWQDGRVFLAGDAAHQTPPFFGQGMCHGLRDVANLAWKLVLVLQGSASEQVLETYQVEREPHVRSVISAAVGAGRYICMLDPDEAKKRDDEMLELMKEKAPQSAAELVPAIVDGVVSGRPEGKGVRFIQPVLEGSLVSGRQKLLDDETGDGWRFFAANTAILKQVRGALNETCPGLTVAYIDLDTLSDKGAMKDWLKGFGAVGVLVRPDFYAFGMLKEAEDARRFASDLASTLTWQKNLPLETEIIA